MRQQSRKATPRVIGLSALAICVGLVTLSACSSSPSNGAKTNSPRVTSVVVAHAAGINGDAVESLLKEFTKETGIAATGITMSDTDYGAKMQLAAKTKRPNFDVALGVGTDIYNLTKDSGIYGTLETSNWAPADLAAMKSAHLIGKDYAVSQETAALLVASKTLKEQPTTWADFFNTTKFPGNRGLASAGLGVPINLEYANIADGTKPSKIYPLNVKTAISKIASLKNHVVLWDNAPVALQAVANGDTVMTWAYAPAVLAAQAAGQPIIASAPPGTVVTSQVAVALKGGPNGQAASNAFLDWWYKTSTQVKYTAATHYGIVVPSKRVLSHFNADQLKYMPFAGPNPENYHVLDYTYYGSTGPNGQSNLSDILNAWSAYRAN